MLKLIHTPENIFADADVYLRIYIGGTVMSLAFYAKGVWKVKE